MTVDQIISGIASLAALAVALATFLTVWQIAKQRRTSYRPELVVSGQSFDTEDQEGPREISSFLDWREYEAAKKRDTKPELSKFSLHLSNIGLGAAKDVSIEWDFPIERFIREIVDFAQEAKVPVQISFKNGAVSIEKPMMFSIWKNQRRNALDYVLPAAVQGEPFYLKVPHAYIVTMAAAVYVFFHPDAMGLKGFDRLKIPPLNVRLQFEDIAGDKHSAAYDIDLEIHGVSPKKLSGRLEAKKQRL